MTRLHFASLSLALLLSFTAAQARSDAVFKLDICLANPARIQTVFSERYPHETCTIGQTCDPKLVQSAKTLATQRCRIEAVQSCAGDGDCTTSLAAHWTQQATEISETLRESWARIDQTRLTSLAQRRFGRPGVFTLQESCPDTIGGTALPCETTRALANLSRMEKLQTYLAAEIGRP